MPTADYDALSRLEGLLSHEARAEIRRLRDFEADMLDSLKFKVGDRVTLKRTPVINRATAWGWMGYEGMLVPGNPATITEVRWNGSIKGWSVLLRFDVQWSQSNQGRIYPVEPERPKHFMFRMTSVRRLRKGDVAPVIPPEVSDQ